MKKPARAERIVGRCYRVWWRDSQPFIECGVIVAVQGPKRTQRRVRFPSSKSFDTSPPIPTIKEAIETEIIQISVAFGGGPWRRRPEEPWVMMRCMNKISRLAAKLRRHNLL